MISVCIYICVYIYIYTYVRAPPAKGADDQIAQTDGYIG